MIKTTFTKLFNKLKIFYKKEKKIAFLLLFLLFLLLLSPILSNNYLIEIPKKGGEINEIIIGSRIRFVNPTIAISQIEKDLLPLIYSPLLKRDTNGQLVSNVATVTLLEDKKTYLVKLKKNVYFSNNQLLSSDDVIFTIKTIQDPLIKSPLASEFLNVKYKKIDDFQLELTLNEEYSQFKDTLTHLYILPKKLWETTSHTEFPFSTLNIQPIGSGPYMVKKINRSLKGEIIKYELTRNVNYHNKDNVFLDNINFYFFKNKSEYLNSLIYSDRKIIKNMSLVSTTSIDELNNSIAYLKANVEKIKNPKVFGLFLKTENEFLKDEDIRKLIKLSINKEEITKNIFNNFAEPLDSILFDKPLKITNNENEYQKIIENLEKKEYIKKEDGLLYDKNQRAIKLNIQIIDSKEFADIANNIKNQLKKSGIEIDIVKYEENNFLDEAVRNRNFDLLLFGYQTNLKQDFFHLFHSTQIYDPGLNISEIKDKKIDDLILNLRKELSKEERKNQSDQLDDLIIGKNTFIPLYNPYYLYIMDSRIKAFQEKTINSIENRFNHVENWYIKTERILPFFDK